LAHSFFPFFCFAEKKLQPPLSIGGLSFFRDMVRRPASFYIRVDFPSVSFCDFPIFFFFSLRPKPPRFSSLLLPYYAFSPSFRRWLERRLFFFPDEAYSFALFFMWSRFSLPCAKTESSSLVFEVPPSGVVKNLSFALLSSPDLLLKSPFFFFGVGLMGPLLFPKGSPLFFYSLIALEAFLLSLSTKQLFFPSFKLRFSSFADTPGGTLPPPFSAEKWR